MGWHFIILIFLSLISSFCVLVSSFGFSSFVFLKEECDLKMRNSLSLIQLQLICMHEAKAANQSTLYESLWETFQKNYSDIADLEAIGFRMDELEKVVCKRDKELLNALASLLMSLENRLCLDKRFASHSFELYCAKKSREMTNSFKLWQKYSDFMFISKCENNIKFTGYRDKSIDDTCKSNDTFLKHLEYLLCRMLEADPKGLQIYRQNLVKKVKGEEIVTSTTPKGAARSFSFLRVYELAYFLLLQMILERCVDQVVSYYD